jgi:hypothetical protein
MIFMMGEKEAEADPASDQLHGAVLGYVRSGLAVSGRLDEHEPAQQLGPPRRQAQAHEAPHGQADENAGGEAESLDELCRVLREPLHVVGRAVVPALPLAAVVVGNASVLRPK